MADGAPARAGGPRVPEQPFLSPQAQGRRRQARTRAEPGRSRHGALHHQGRAEGESGRASPVGRRPGGVHGRGAARAPDLRHHGTPARLPGHQGRLVRFLSLLRAVALRLRDSQDGHGHGGVLVRTVDRLLERVLCRAGPGVPGLPRGRAVHRSADRRAPELSDHRARLHALLRALPRGDRGEERDRPRQAGAHPHHLAHGRARRLHSGHPGQDRGRLRGQGVRSARSHRDRRVGVRVRGALRPRPRARGLLLPRGPRRGGSARRAGRPGRAGVHQPLSQGHAAAALPDPRRRPARGSEVSVRADLGGLRGRASTPGSTT